MRLFFFLTIHFTGYLLALPKGGDYRATVFLVRLTSVFFSLACLSVLWRVISPQLGMVKTHLRQNQTDPWLS
jgi:hypothetical protein